MNPDIVTTLADVFRQLVPECILGGSACVLFLGATFRRDRNLWGWVALLALAGTALALLAGPQPSVPTNADAASAQLFGSPFYFDGLAQWIRWISLAGGVLLVLCSWDDIPDDHAAEYHACVLVLIAGMCLTGAANELVSLFLALELISIPTYILLYLPRVSPASQEAALKYFLLSIFSSGLLLFGFSYLYGLSGTTNLPAMLETLRAAGATNLPLVAEVALVMVVAGLCFRIAAVPFHFYAPDVYQGTTPSAAALLAYTPKVAGFAALIRVLGLVAHAFPGPVGTREGFGPLGFALGGQTLTLLWILAAVTMTIGNVLGLLQDNLKRLLAYSSVAHAGYMLMGLAAAPYLSASTGERFVGGVDAVLNYLAAYGAMTIGAFAVIAYLSSAERPVERIDDLAGLGMSRPGVAILMAIFLFSLIGIPLTAGFIGKAMLFLGALTSQPEAAATPSFLQQHLLQLLALVAAINAAIGAVYYLRIIATMYLRLPIRPLERGSGRAGLAAVVLCAIATIVAGVYPELLWRPVRDALPQPHAVQAAQR